MVQGVAGFRVGMFRLILRVLNRDTPVMIPIKDCQYQGEHPKAWGLRDQTGETRGFRVWGFVALWLGLQGFGGLGLGVCGLGGLGLLRLTVAFHPIAPKP